MKKQKQDSPSLLVRNTFFLYLLTVSNHFLSLITVPYLTRVLGPVTYGKNGVALAYMFYVSVMMDLGFLLSATQKVVEHKSDVVYLGKLIFAVSSVKVVTGTVVAAIFALYVAFSETLGADFWFYMLYLLAFLVNGLLPDYFYRGMEQMQTITVRTLVVKSFFAVMTVVLIKTEQDYEKIPIITLLGNCGAVIAMYADLHRTYRIPIRRTSVREVVGHVKDTLPFFVSRIASTVYQALNTIVLSTVYGASPLLGCYTSADKIRSLSRTAASPIADSLYPYMLRKQNYALVKKLLLIAMPLIAAAAAMVFVYAEAICVFLFGQAYAQAGTILRCLLPSMVVVLPSYVLCFPVMVPIGLSKYANRSNVVGMIIQFAGLAVLLGSGRLTIHALCLLSSLSEVSVFVYRGAVVWYFRKRRW